MAFSITPIAMDQPGLIAIHYLPRAPLSDFIELFWYYRNPAPCPPAKERLLPSGTVEFVIRLTENKNRVFDSDSCKEYSGSIITGPQTKFFVLDKSEQDHLIGIHFKPGGAFPFFGVATNELQNTHASLEDLWGSGAHELRCDLLEADSAPEKFSILERYLMRASRSLSHHPAVRFALRQFQNIPSAQSISQVAEKVNLSQRRFIQLFHEQVGLTPKMFCRIQRFQEALKLVHREARVDWLDVALSCGYYDQAHFIRDFKDFSGINPTRYLRDHTDQLNHVPM